MLYAASRMTQALPPVKGVRMRSYRNLSRGCMQVSIYVNFCSDGERLQAVNPRYVTLTLRLGENCILERSGFMKFPGTALAAC